MGKHLSFFAFVILLVASFSTNGQTIDSVSGEIEYTDLNEALKHPEDVTRLNLSNQSFTTFPVGLDKFTNLKYLNLRNDHLKFIPSNVFKLEKLEVLDLSSNDFKTLPDSLSRLKNLREVYLDDDPQLDLKQSFTVLEKLPRLNSLHLENDNVKRLPSNVQNLTHLENLYLSHNKLRPKAFHHEELPQLKYMEIQDNRFTNYKLPDLETFGVKVVF